MITHYDYPVMTWSDADGLRAFSRIFYSIPTILDWAASALCKNAAKIPVFRIYFPVYCMPGTFIN